jgi:glycosyltransferase involved in cell wall biosynthesis
MSNSDSSPIKISALVAMPGPVTGMTVATKYIVEFLGANFPTTLLDLSLGYSRRGMYWRIRKFSNGIFGCLRLVQSRIGGSKTLLLAPNASWGLIVTLLHTVVAKLLGMRVLLHHHVYSYCSRKSRLMSLVQGMLGPRDVNLVLNETMGQELQRLYHTKAMALELPYGYLTDSVDSQQRSNRVMKPVVLGHLSNLTIEKGLEDVIESAVTLKNKGSDIKLLLAGGLKGDREKEVFTRGQQLLGSSLEYLGPVYGDAKSQFFDRIDFFLFPSRYANEAQPVVILEALAAGVPVVATPIGCIPGMIQSDFGKLVESAAYPIEAAKFVDDVSSTPERYAQMSLAASEFSEQFRIRSHKQLAALVECIKS